MLRLVCRPALRVATAPSAAAAAAVGRIRPHSGRANVTRPTPPVLVHRLAPLHSQRAGAARSIVTAAPSVAASVSSTLPPALPAHAAGWMDQRAQRPNLHWSRRRATKSNVVLMGPPGSGKTSVGKILAARLGRRFVDVDDDVLEVAWAPQRVSDVLRAVGDEAFVQREGEALMAHKVTGAVLSLSGSNPLHAASLEHVAKDGLLVYLDIDPAEILARCERMKVDRIVGQSSHSLESILAYRQSVYENSYDLRVLITHGETPEQIASKIEGMLQRREEESYISTRGYAGPTSAAAASGGAKLDFLDVVAQGLSPDRGLFVPAHLESLRFSPQELQRLQHLTYQELALRVMERFPLGDRLHPSVLRRLLYEGYASFNSPEILPVVPLRPVLAPPPSAASTSAPAFHERMWLMETWHGPTASFKDLSLQLLPKLLRAALENQRRPAGAVAQPVAIPRVGLLVATSGDTGTAALDGFSRQEGMPVMVLYPSNGVSIVQRAQMQTTPGDVLVLGVDSDFDYCQSLVKDVFNDAALRAEFAAIVPNLMLSSANSMNWGRFLPQIVFSISSYLRLVVAGEIRFGQPLDLVVPTGNFGNILGAVYAQRVLGLPLGRIVCASNSNNVLYEFLRSGRYDLRKRTFHQTVSPSIDILVSSNLERFLHLLACGDEERAQVKGLFEQLAKEGHFEVPERMRARMQQQVQAGWASESECLATIKDTHDRTGVLIDPHTAVAVHVANVMLGPSAANSGSVSGSGSSVTPVLVASTAHYAKFPNAMCAALGKEVSPADASNLPAMLSALSMLSPSFASSMHPQLLDLARQPVLHADHCDASLASVVEHIRRFLTEFQRRHSKE